MPRCNLCNREFKNGAGLAGHYQLKHASERFQERLEHSAVATQELHDPSAVAASKRQEQTASERSEDRLERIQESLDRLVALEEVLEVLIAGLKHEHGVQCDLCQDFLQENQDPNPDDDHPVEHEHGDNCSDCVHEQMKGVRRSAVWHDQNVPGAKEAREHAMTGEQKVTIVDDRQTVNTEDMDDASFKLVLLGMAREAGETGDPELINRVGGMMVEANRRGIR